MQNKVDFEIMLTLSFTIIIDPSIENEVVWNSLTKVYRFEWPQFKKKKRKALHITIYLHQWIVVEHYRLGVEQFQKRRPSNNHTFEAR